MTLVLVYFPSFGEGGLASSWTGVCDVIPDWNSVLGRVLGIQGLAVGHGFKLSPDVGRILAQEALERFSTGRLLSGK